MVKTLDENARDNLVKIVRIECPYCKGCGETFVHDADTLEVISREICLNCEGLCYQDLYLMSDLCE